MSDLPPERWLAVAGFEGLYEVSDCGRVRSLDRPRHPGCVLRGTVEGDGYQHVSLSRDGRRTRKRRKIGRLVAEAFIGPCPPGHELCHGLKGSQDDSLANLSWGTKEQNNGPDKLRDGTLLRGERHGRAKLTEADVIEIRRLYATGEWSMRVLADRFGVNKSNIGRIISGQTWKHL